MAEGSGGQERTEQPTARQRSRARGQGRVARSTELSTAAVLLSGALVFTLVGAASFGNFTRRLLRECTAGMSFDAMGTGGMVGILHHAAEGFLLAFLPFALGLTVLVVLVNLWQAKGVVSLTPITPKLSNINPVGGFKKMFNMDALFRGLKAVLKLVVVGTLTYIVVSRSLPDLVALSETDPAEIASVLKRLILRLAFLMGAAYLLVAVIDYRYQHHKMEKSLKMTRQEVYYDHKDSEGDPHMKGRIQAIARANARRRMLQRVPSADVIVVNPTRIAVALKYDVDLAPAPLVLAMGQRKLAQRIRSIAVDAGVPIVENVTVARALLATAKVGKTIPPALYTAVAEILAFVYRMRGGLSGLPDRLIPGRRP